MNSRPSLLQYLLGVVLCQSAGVAGAFLTVAEISTWYAGLVRPSWQPPSWLFGPVWTTLYFLMGIAGARIWSRTAPGDGLRRLFAAQLLLNALWTPVFFGTHNLLGGLVIILTMDVIVAVLLFKVFRIDRVSAWCLLPYLCWILFATVLNATILILNPTQ